MKASKRKRRRLRKLHDGPTVDVDVISLARSMLMNEIAVAQTRGYRAKLVELPDQREHPSDAQRCRLCHEPIATGTRATVVTTFFAHEPTRRALYAFVKVCAGCYGDGDEVVHRIHALMLEQAEREEVAAKFLVH